MRSHWVLIHRNKKYHTDLDTDYADWVDLAAGVFRGG